jgi:hypothetical protein
MKEIINLKTDANQLYKFIYFTTSRRKKNVQVFDRTNIIGPRRRATTQLMIDHVSFRL